jgi:hypothetical protein
MSYCNFGTDDHKCDIYAYENRGQWIIHVAENRLVGKCPRVAPLGSVPAETFLMQTTACNAFLATAKRKRIGLPHDGDSMYLDDLEDFAATLAMLRAEGYRFPNYVFEAINAEMEETV